MQPTERGQKTAHIYRQHLEEEAGRGLLSVSSEPTGGEEEENVTGGGSRDSTLARNIPHSENSVAQAETERMEMETGRAFAGEHQKTSVNM